MKKNALTERKTKSGLDAKFKNRYNEENPKKFKKIMHEQRLLKKELLNKNSYPRRKRLMKMVDSSDKKELKKQISKPYDYKNKPKKVMKLFNFRKNNQK